MRQTKLRTAAEAATSIAAVGALALSLVGCDLASADDGSPWSSSSSTSSSSSATAEVVEGSLLDTSAMFTARDLQQTADLSEATYVTVVSGQEVSITAGGVYVLSGDAEDATVVVEADDEAKVQLVLDGLTIINASAPAIYVASADKVFVTTASDDNLMEVSGAFVADGDTNLDAVIFSKDDLVLNGTGFLEVVSVRGNGVTSKDDLKVTGGSWLVTADADGLEANDSVRISDGELTIEAGEDGIHAEYDEDDSVGYVYISGGAVTISAGDDGVRATTVVQVDGGVIDVETSTEGIEGTAIQINDGEITIYATDDGINAAAKSSAYDVVIIVNGGTVSVTVGSGDTDGFDSNGDIYVNGGTLSVQATSAFDWDGTAELNGGTVTINGQVVTQLTQSMGAGGGGHH